MRNHREKQKYLEWQAIKPVIPFINEILGINIECDGKYESEEPDFVFMNERKSIGVEVVECHPSCNLYEKDKSKKSFGKGNAPALESYKYKVCEAFSKNAYLESITEGSDNKLCVIIDSGSQFSTKHDVSSICATLEYYLVAFHEGIPAKKGEIIRGIRVTKTKGHNIVYFNNIGSVDSIQSSCLCKCIEKKNQKLPTYKKRNPCSEYWLCIYLPYEEFKTAYDVDNDCEQYFEILSKSKFNRIFVTSRLWKDLRWLKGNPQK